MTPVSHNRLPNGTQLPCDMLVPVPGSPLLAKASIVYYDESDEHTPYVARLYRYVVFDRAASTVSRVLLTLKDYITIEPCAHCGDSASMIYETGNSKIKCDECGIATPGGYPEVQIELWNRRK